MSSPQPVQPVIVEGKSSTWETIYNFVGHFPVELLKTRMAYIDYVTFSILNYTIEIDDADIEISKTGLGLSPLKWNIKEIYRIIFFDEDGDKMALEDEAKVETMKRIYDNREAILAQAAFRTENKTNLPGKFVMDLIQAIINFCKEELERSSQ